MFRRMFGDLFIWCGVRLISTGTRVNPRRYVILSTGAIPYSIATDVEGLTEKYLRDMEVLQLKALTLRDRRMEWR